MKASSIPKFFQQDLQEQINKGLQEWTKKQGSNSENNAQSKNVSRSFQQTCCVFINCLIFFCLTYQTAEEKLFDRVWNERQKNKTVTGSKKLPSKSSFPYFF